MIELTVDRSRLGAMTELDSGAAGVVYRLDGYRLPGFGPLGYKQYKNTQGADADRNLYELVAFRRNLPPTEMAVIDANTAWPLQVVTERGRVCGLVMQLIPGEFFSNQTLPSGRTTTVVTKAQWLVVEHAKAVRAGVDVPPADDLPARLVLVARLAHVFATLHRAGLVYGDLSLNNVTVCGQLPPRIVVVDCDAIKTPSAPALVQLHSPGFKPPEQLQPGTGQTVATDEYKLALFILRCLTPGRLASLVTDSDRLVGIFDAKGVAMMRAGVGNDPAARPAARDWYRYLVDRLAQLTSPRVFESIEIDQRVIVEGEPVVVRWRTTGAPDEVQVRTQDGFEQTKQAVGNEGTFTICPLRSGVVELLAGNRYGRSSGVSPALHVMTVPRINAVNLPSVPPLPATIGGAARDFEGVAAALTAPSVSVHLPGFDASVIERFAGSGSPLAVVHPPVIPLVTLPVLPVGTVTEALARAVEQGRQAVQARATGSAP